MPWKAEILIYVFKFIFKFHVNSLLEPGNEGVQKPVKQLRWSLEFENFCSLIDGEHFGP